jgi:hypothetical protein
MRVKSGLILGEIKRKIFWVALKLYCGSVSLRIFHVSNGHLTTLDVHRTVIGAQEYHIFEYSDTYTVSIATGAIPHESNKSETDLRWREWPRDQYILGADRV